MKRFRKISVITAITLVLSILSSCIVSAAPLEFSGGVNSEYIYEEYVFLSGEPVKFKGTYKITESDRGEQKTINYTFKLTSVNKAYAGKYDKSYTFNINATERNDKGQTITSTELSKYKETITISGVKYELKDYQFSKSDVIDNRPASDFYSGNIQGRKYYEINKNEGVVTVEISGGDAGYKNFWGSSETNILNYVITSNTTKTDNGKTTNISWQGTVGVQSSDSTVKKLSYSDNDANFSSFYGGNVRETDQEIVSKLDYNLPKFSNGLPDSKKRSASTLSMSQSMMPKIERLVVPKFRDVRGHWAEDHINKLYSLDVFDDVNEFFIPDVSITRIDFIKAVLRSCNIRTVVETKKTNSRTKTIIKEESPYSDVPITDKNYEFVKDAGQKGLITGMPQSLFMPNDPLTRAQAVTILIRALGFDSKAPNPGYKTQFADDQKIGEWAKDSIYMAKEIGLLQGDSNNRVNPNKILTRAEASAMLVRFLEFLQKDLQKDYRENIILY